MQQSKNFLRIIMKLREIPIIAILILQDCKQGPQHDSREAKIALEATAETTPATTTTSPQNSEPDTLESKYFSSGKLESAAFAEYHGEKNVKLTFSESGILASKIANYSGYPRTTSEYDAEGKKIHEWTDGDIGGCIGPVGKELFWAANGTVMKEINYQYSDAPCSEKVTRTTEKTFFAENGGTKSVQNYLQSYEGSEPCPCGTWTDFDNKGTIISQREYAPCDGSPLCN